jgi:hypothetical protein
VRTFSDAQVSGYPHRGGRPVDYAATVRVVARTLYHVTFAGRLEGIEAHGLDPATPGAWHGAYAEHSRGWLHLTELDGVYFWYNRLEALAEHYAEGEEMLEWVPVVLRVLVEERNLEEDALGTRDAPAEAWRTKEHIPPELIEAWDRDGWVENITDVDTESALEQECEDVFESDGEEWQDCWYNFVRPNPLIDAFLSLPVAYTGTPPGDIPW